MAGTEGTVEFEMIDIVEERASDREKDVLKQKLFFITRKEIVDYASSPRKAYE